MCEYCFNEERNTYDMVSPEYGVNGHLSIDEYDNGLYIEFDWKQERDNYGLAAKVLIRYCPWCGRKLELREK